jgi:glutathione S-transferase
VIDHPGKAPKKKAPWVTIDGTSIGDSTFIIEELSRRHGIDPDAWLSPKQRAVAQAVKAMIEDHLYFAVAHLHFVWQPGWAVIKTVLDGVPAPMRPIVSYLMYRHSAKVTHYQGMGRHAIEEMCDLAVRDLDALAELLEGPWFFGERPCNLDATVFGALSGLVWIDIDTSVHARAREHEPFVAYCERIRDRLFPELSPRTCEVTAA